MLCRLTDGQTQHKGFYRGSSSFHYVRKGTNFVFATSQDRLTISPEAYPSIAVAVSRIYKDGGLGAFYAGLAPTLIGILPYSTCYYFMYEKLKKSYCLAFKKKSLSRADMLLVGALSGANLVLFQFLTTISKIGSVSLNLCGAKLFLFTEGSNAFLTSPMLVSSFFI